MPYVIAWNSVEFSKETGEGKSTVLEYPQVPYATWDTAAIAIGDACPYDANQKCYKLEAKCDSPAATSQIVTMRVKAYFRIPKPGEWSPDEGGDTYSTLDMDFGVEHVSMEGTVTIPVGGSYGDVTISDQTFPIGVVVININRTVDDWPMADIVTYNNKVNDDTVLFNGQSFAAGKVLFDGAKLTNEISSTGAAIYHVSYQFRAITNPTDATWLKVPRAANGSTTWYATEPAIYETASLATFIATMQEGGGT